MKRPESPALLLPASVARQIRRHARRQAPQECCGILLGRSAAGALPARVEEAREAANTTPKDPEKFYEVSPVDLLAAHRAARSDGKEVIGYYHSHPGGAAVPSAEDLVNAWPRESYLIVGRTGELRSWRLQEGGRDFYPEPLQIMEDPPEGQWIP